MNGIIGSAISKQLIGFVALGGLSLVAVASTASYFIGHGKASEHYLQLDKERVQKEAEADLKSLGVMMELAKNEAVAMAERVGRAEQRAEDALEREKSAWKIEAKTRQDNAELNQNIIKYQAEAEAAGDYCGAAPLNSGVSDTLDRSKKSLLDRLDRQAVGTKQGQTEFKAITAPLLPLPISRE